MTFIQLGLSEPGTCKTRPLRPGQPWHIAIDNGKRTACGRSMFTVAAITEKAGTKVCVRCRERLQRPTVASRVTKS